MLLVLVVVLAGLIGYLTGRWAVLFLGPAAGAAVLGMAAVQHQNLWDNPTVFAALTTTAALAAGVALRTGRGSATRAG